MPCSKHGETTTQHPGAGAGRARPGRRVGQGARDPAARLCRAISRECTTAVRTRARPRSIQQLERRYRAAVAGSAPHREAAAALPGVGTATSIATGAAEIAAFVSATAMYVLALAELHGIPVSDPEVRRALVLAAWWGRRGTIAIDGTAVEAGSTWAQVLGRRTSKESLGGLNGRWGMLPLTRFGARQGALLVGRAVPFGHRRGHRRRGQRRPRARRHPGRAPHVRAATQALPGRVIDVPVRKDPAR